jgi:predicted transposase/invertase (TIGR01784 family)
MPINQKDIISKQIFKRIFIDVATYIFKLQLAEVELIETEQQRIEDRRADLVASVVDNNGNAFIVHLEIQNQNQVIMPDRMLRYLSDIRLNYPKQTVYQYLLYIGKAALTMPDGITTEQLQYHYQVIDMHELDYRFFLKQNSADALVLTVLCDFKETEPRAVVHEILQRLMALQQNDLKSLREYVSMLEILADNRDLQLDIQEEFKMLEVNIERLPSFLIGKERGIEKGLEQGAHDKALAIANQLVKLNMSLADIAQVTGLELEELRRVCEQIQNG